MVLSLVADELDRLHERIAGRFSRAEPRARVRRYVSGMVAVVERKNGWTLAEQAGETCPDRLLRSADWDVDGVRDQPPDPEHAWAWSRWRRKRQYQARICHYQRRGYALA
jgi:hypothetical protein